MQLPQAKQPIPFGSKPLVPPTNVIPVASSSAPLKPIPFGSKPIAPVAPDPQAVPKNSGLLPIGDRIKQVIQKRGEAMAGAFDGSAPASQGEGSVVRGFQVAGEGAGAVLDVAGEALKSVFQNVKSAPRDAEGHLMNPDGTKSNAIDWQHLLSDGVQKFKTSYENDVKAGEAKGRTRGIDILANWANSNPEHAKPLISALKVAKSSGDISSAILTAQGAAELGNKLPILKAPVSQVPAAVKQTATQIVDKGINALDNVRGNPDYIKMTLDNHLGTIRQELANIPPDMLAARGGPAKLLEQNQTDIVLQLQKKGLADKAARVQNVDVSKFSSFDDYENAIRDSLDDALHESVKNTMPFQNKDQRIESLRNALPESGPGKGGVIREGKLGTSTPQPSAADIAVGKDAHPFIKGVKDPVKRIQNVNKGIIDVSDETNSFLDANPTNGHFDDIKTYMETNNRPSATLARDPGASEAYKRATDNAINTLNDTLRETAKKTGDYGPSISGADIRRARINVDREISKQLGDTVFDSPQYKGIKAAEVDTRNLINRMNEDMIRYPGQLEKLNKMNELIDVTRGRGIEIDLANPQIRAGLEKQFGLVSTPEAAANAEKVAAAHSKMSNLYTARDNMIDVYQGNLGKNKFFEWVKENPAKAKAAGIGASLLGGKIIYETALH